MCGIAGMVRTAVEEPVAELALRRMARAIRHRGPDGFGLALGDGAGFVSTRLAIVDLASGWQPVAAPSGGLLVYNGEAYNHPELRRELESQGRSFATSCDTEVVLRALEEWDLAALDRLNGQFAFAWWQPRRRRLTLVRDRFGVRPLYYAYSPDRGIVFGSEAKALFASGEIAAAPDLRGIDEVFTLWGPRPPRTAFAGVRQVPAGGLVIWERGEIVEERLWWTPSYGECGRNDGGEADLGDLLEEGIRLRFRADVPVGAYLSGGLDSSLITALAQRRLGPELKTFSVAFKDPRYDERSHQEAVAKALGTSHHVVEVGPAEIADTLPDVIRHAEMPLIRTAPVPLFLLAREVRRRGLTVVVTGEGADELFWGYDLFKEVAVRELHGREPERATALLDQLYPYLGPGGARRGPAWRRFLLGAGANRDPLSSHLTRARATATVKSFYRPEVADEVREGSALQRLRCDLPSGFQRWNSLERAAWIELATLLEPNLLSVQGDRVAMAHGVEGRFPFLDHRVFAYAASLPPDRKLAGLRDKIALRELAAELLPRRVADRPKQPYRAPDVPPFFGPEAPGWVDELLSPAVLDRTGIWDAGRVEALLRRCRAGRATGVREGMALVGILSTQLWHSAFTGGGAGRYPAETAEPRVRIDARSRTIEEVA